jgi:hypothetical protein
VVNTGIWAVIPSLTSPFAQLYSIDCLDFCNFMMSQKRSSVHSLMLTIFWMLAFFLMFFSALAFELIIIDFLLCLNKWNYYFANTIGVYPLVHPAVYALIMNVVFVTRLNFLFGGIEIYNKLKKSRKKEKNYIFPVSI